jgi:cell wall-associated NlpC family hydrolase
MSGRAQKTNSTKRFIAAFAAIYIIPFIILLASVVVTFVIMGFQNEDAGQKIQMNSEQIKVVRPGITRKEVIDIALTLVGRVKYWWGGHSAPGWNPLWGTPMLVTAPGDWSSGTYQPYGLDCSGFVTWVFESAGTTELNGTTVNQLAKTYPIDESQLEPGDLVFMNVGNTSKNHVGIFYKCENGKNLYIHCQGGTGVVINSTTVFKYWRRPYIKFNDDRN